MSPSGTPHVPALFPRSPACSVSLKGLKESVWTIHRTSDSQPTCCPFPGPCGHSVLASPTPEVGQALPQRRVLSDPRRRAVSSEPGQRQWTFGKSSPAGNWLLSLRR